VKERLAPPAPRVPEGVRPSAARHLERLKLMREQRRRNAGATSVGAEEGDKSSSAKGGSGDKSESIQEAQGTNPEVQRVI